MTAAPLAVHIDVIALALLTALSGILSLGLTRVVQRWTVRNSVLDHPNERSSHTAPTPRGGGIAIVAASAITMAIGAAQGIILVREASALGGGMLIVAAIGWLDDRRSVRAVYRLSVQLIAALLALYLLGGLPQIRLGSAVLDLGIGGWVLGTIGIVWSTNLFNFMDGIDGLAGSQALLIFGAAAALLALRGEPSLAAVAAILAAASAGFLPSNWPPAKIFMGDVGSGSIGFTIAALAIASENEHSVPLLGFAIMGGVFVVDATVTLIRRLRRGHRAAEAHRDHAYQRLSRACGSHRPVTVRAAGITLGLIALGAIATFDDRLSAAAALIALLVLGGLLVVIERRAPM